MRLDKTDCINNQLKAGEKENYVHRSSIYMSFNQTLFKYCIVIRKRTHDRVKVVSNQASTKKRQVGNMTSYYKDKYVMRVKGDNEHYVNKRKIGKI